MSDQAQMEAAQAKGIQVLCVILNISLEDKGWCNERETYAPRSDLPYSCRSHTLLTKCLGGTISRIPRPISRTSSHLSSNPASKSSGEPASETNVHHNHSLYKTFYQDLKSAFKAFHATHPNETSGIIHISSRYFEVCWTLDDPYEHDTLYGRVAVFHDELPLTLMMSEGREISVVKVGMIDRFPMSGALLYYCDNDDMLYFFPIEGLEDEPKHSCRHLYEFGRFREILNEFPWFILALVDIGILKRFCVEYQMPYPNMAIYTQSISIASSLHHL